MISGCTPTPCAWPLERYLLEFIHDFSVFINGFGSTGKGVDLNIETFVCDGSDNGVACN